MIVLRALVVLTLVLAQLVKAAPALVSDTYPAGSIDSVEKADRALLQAQSERDKSDADFTAAQYACVHTILVNACLADAKKKHLAHAALIDRVEIEAKRVKRVAQGDQSANERKEKMDSRDANAAQDAVQRAQSKSDFESKQTDAAHKAEQNATDSQGAPARALDYANKVKDAARKQADEDATRRTHTAQAPEALAQQAQKESDARDRHERLAKKHAEQEEERQKKAADQAAKNANLPPPPPPQFALPGQSSVAPDKP